MVASDTFDRQYIKFEMWQINFNKSENFNFNWTHPELPTTNEQPGVSVSIRKIRDKTFLEEMETLWKERGTVLGIDLENQ